MLIRRGSAVNVASLFYLESTTTDHPEALRVLEVSAGVALYPEHAGGATDLVPLVDVVKVGSSDGFSPKMQALLETLMNETAAVNHAPGPDTLPADPSLVPYVLRVRERAYGWPGGISPSKAAGKGA